MPFKSETTRGELSCSAAAGSVATVFNGIKESWRLARKILFLVLTVIREMLTLLAILHLEIAKNLFAAGSAEQLNSPQAVRNQDRIFRSQDRI